MHYRAIRRAFRFARFEVQPEGVPAGGGASAGGDGAGAEGADGDGAGKQNPPSFDDFLKDPNNQSEFDRRVAKALATAHEKWEAASNEKLSEAEKLAKMNKEEKREYMVQKKEGELAAREKEIARRELMAEAKNQLTAKGLPIELADTLDYTSADTCSKSIDSVQQAFQKAVEARVEARLKGGAPDKKAPETDANKQLEAEILQYMKG